MTFHRFLPLRPRLGCVALLALVGSLPLAAQPARAQTSPAPFRTLYTLQLSSNGQTQVSPLASGLILGRDGNFYGTTQLGGDNGTGTVFRLTPDGTQTVLHSFSAIFDRNGYGSGTNADGAKPGAELVQGGDGAFYGSTAYGGPNGTGTIFKVTSDGTLTTVHPFDAQTSGGSANHDGYAPSRLIVGRDGFFYGTASLGGPNNTGTVFRLAADGTLTVLYSFGDGTVFGNGHSPGPLVQGGDGAFYGTAGGGDTGWGIVYKLTADGTLTVLHNFAAVDATAGNALNADGALPQGGLTLGSDGNFYGTTSFAGGGGGTVFKITPDGTLTTLHFFGGADPYSDTKYREADADGNYPAAALVQGSDGKFYGTAAGGGVNGTGTVFSVTPDGAFALEHVFSAVGTLNQPITGSNNDGAGPAAALVQGSDGAFYGTTASGGESAGGVVFRLQAGAGHPAFFSGETRLNSGAYYLYFFNENAFGFYSYLTDPHYIYHFDLGYEYVFDAGDDQAGVYLYDFASGGFFYTSPRFPFPYLYDFSLNSTVYYYPNPDPASSEQYNTDGVRYFYVFSTGQIISK